MLKIVSITLIIISILLIICSVYSIRNTHQINESIDKANKLKQEKLDELNELIELKEEEAKQQTYDINSFIDNYNNQKERCEERINHLKYDINEKQKELSNLQLNVTQSLDNQKELSQKAFENYCEVLVKNYEEKEKEYQDSLTLLSDSYTEIQTKLLKSYEEAKEENDKKLQEKLSGIAEEIAKEQQQLDQIRATRIAAVQAQLKEKEIEEQLSFYCLQVTDNEMKDIAVLESIKPKLNNPRILSMLIQQTYWRTPMTKLCNNVIGTTIKTGIYKITNQKTKECYIGQAVDLASRFKEHAKCGLGIDTPAANKLYKSMQEYGIWNFSWEVLEECPKNLLDEKEKYYIELYQSKEYGFNTQAGNK